MIGGIREALDRAIAVLRRRQLDREFDEELATHLDLLAAQIARDGVPPEEARRRAILRLGGMNSTRRGHRESRGLPWLERVAETVHGLGKDFAHAARSLARARAFTLVCAISLGVGMGSFVALATFARAMRAPARGIETTGLVELLVAPLGPLRARTGVAMIEEWSYPDFKELQASEPGIDLTGWAMGVMETGVSGAEDEARAPTQALFVSANYFNTFGVSLARGPGFDPAVDDMPNAAPRVVVSDGYWRNRLASDPDTIGKMLTLDDVPHTIVGIAPAEFRGHFNALSDRAPRSIVFVPLERHPRIRTDPDARFGRDVAWVHVHGRLTPGVDLPRARASVAATMSRLAVQYRGTNEFKLAAVEPYFGHGAARRSEMISTSLRLLGLDGMVLLIVCVNISGMMLVRGAVRERELSIREAVGASRRRLVQYLFFEAVWLAVGGAALSVLVLFGIPAGIARWLGQTVPPELDLDGPAVGICLGLCLAVSLVLGLLPAIRLSRPSLVPALKDDVAGGGWRVGRIHRAAAAVQVAIAVPFLVVSGVMLDRVRTADFGFDPEGLVAVRFDPTKMAAADRGAISLQTIRDALDAGSGARSVTVANGMPIDFDDRTVRVTRDDRADFVSAHVTRVAEDYLTTLGIPLRRGRSITGDDRSADARVAVLSEPLAARLFPDGDAIGERMTIALEEGRDDTYTVVGVTADFATAQLTTERLQLLLPLPEKPATPLYLIAHGARADETRLVSAFENLRRDYDLEFLSDRFGVFRPVVTGTELVRKSIGDLVAESLAVAVAGGIVLVLASLGVLGVIAFMVTTRTREIAVRMALGATRLRVVGLLLVDVVRVVTPGVVVGLVTGGVLIRTLTDVMGTPLTVGSTPLGAVEPLIYVGAAGIAFGVALVAGLPPARRAASVQPMVAMRSE